MSAADRLDEIEARHGAWYGGADYVGPEPVWPDRDEYESRDTYIIRNDVPALVNALRAVLALCDQQDRMHGTVTTFRVRTAIEWAL